MTRTKGSLNKDSLVRPVTSKLDTDERLRLVANLIVDRVKDDQLNGQKLLKHIRHSHGAKITAP